MEKMNSELEKLISYCIDKEEINEKDVAEICSVHLSEHVFQMTQAIAQADKEKAVKLYLELILLKEPPIGILARITWQFKVLWQIRQMEIGRASCRERV